MQASNQYCLDKIKQSNSNFLYGFWYLPKIKKEAMLTIYAFCREVDDIVDEAKSIMEAQEKISWWKQEVHNIFNKKPTHEISKALSKCLNYFDLDKNNFEELLLGMEMDLQKTKYHSFLDLKKYCYRVASTVGLISVEIFGYNKKAPKIYAENMGIAVQLINIMRDVGEDAANGRVYLPESKLEEFNLNKQDIFSNVYNQNFLKLMNYFYEKAIHYYNIAIDNLNENDIKLQKPGIIMAQTYLSLLREIRNNKYDVFKKRISISTLKKMWIALKYKFFIHSKEALYV